MGLERWEILDIVQRYIRSVTFQDSLKYYTCNITFNDCLKHYVVFEVGEFSRLFEVLLWVNIHPNVRAVVIFT